MDKKYELTKGKMIFGLVVLFVVGLPVYALIYPYINAGYPDFDFTRTVSPATILTAIVCAYLTEEKIVLAKIIAILVGLVLMSIYSIAVGYDSLGRIVTMFIVAYFAKVKLFKGL